MYLYAGSTLNDYFNLFQGDSGGPIVYLDPDTNRYTLVGVVSYGAECASVTPGVNTEVAAYLDWIQKNMLRK